jgi:hypothetical protein
MARTLEYFGRDPHRPTARTGRLASIALFAALLSPVLCFGVAFIPESATRVLARLVHVDNGFLRIVTLPALACLIGLVATVRAIWRRNGHDAVLSIFGLFLSGLQVFLAVLFLVDGVS